MIKPQKPLLDMYLIENALLAPSLTFKIGDTVIIDTGAPESVTGAAGTTGEVLGTIRAFKNGAAQGNTFLQKDEVTTEATNLTVEKVVAIILPSDQPATLVADLDAPVGTTPDSQYFGYFDLSGSDNGVLDESSYSAGTPKQFLSYGVNPGNQSQVVGIWSAVARA